MITRLCTNLHQGYNLDVNDLGLIQIQVSRLRCLPGPDRSKMSWIHYVGSISHSTECRENRPVTMRNADKSLKIPYSVVVRAVIKWSGIHIWDCFTTKSQSVLPTGRPNHNTKFQWNWTITFAVIVLTDKMNQWSTDHITSLAELISFHFRENGLYAAETVHWYIQNLTLHIMTCIALGQLL